ncbi:DUF6093 family protein [Janibacter melonis]|uniref:DUF6093 family protein n=1 Tax=Janibacter melonis TaxID=262209 RepID=UPI0020444914|nr:DUF6093 family protein [Janibacter melonis]MCM3554001.1 DUF6093 family protein [Janibacter melonis]
MSGRPNLVALRQYVDSTLTATGILRRPGELVMDPETLEYVQSFEDVYAGPVLVYATVQPPERPEAGGNVYTVTDYTVVLPQQTAVEIGDVLTVTDAPDAPESVGAAFRISAAPRTTWAVARVCYAEVTE